MIILKRGISQQGGIWDIENKVTKILNLVKVEGNGSLGTLSRGPVGSLHKRPSYPL